MENTNTRAWDEETHPSMVNTEPAYRPGKHGNGRRPVSLQPVYRGETEVSRTIPGRPVMAIGTERKFDSPGLPAREHYRHKHMGPLKDQVVKRVEWAKQNAVNTKRKQDYLDREAKKAAKNMEFLGVPTDDTFPAEGYFFWPDHGIDPSTLLGENLELLDDIRTNCEVYVDFVEALRCIRLRSKSRRNIERGVVGLKATIQHARADVASHAPIYIVEPPAVEGMKFEVTPLFLESPQVGKQPIIIRFVLAGSILSAEQRATWEVERHATIIRNQGRFSVHMMTALADLGPLKRSKRIRVHVGKIHLLRYRKAVEGGYSFQKLSSMMEEVSTQGRFERSIQDPSATGRILDRFSKATSLFEPTDSYTSSLADIEAKHCLIIFAQGKSRQSVRIEADIDMVQCPVQGGAQKDAAWQIGAVKCYHDGHNAQKTRITVGILSVECTFDSCLEISTDEDMLQPPRVFQKLVEGSISGTSSFATENSGLLYPAVRLLVPEGVVVDHVLIKSALQYKLQNTSYIAQVAVYQKWNGSNTKQVPVTSCGISLYHKDWDLLMTPDEGIECPKALDMRSLFPDESCTDDGISSFLAHIQTLRAFVSVSLL